MINGIRRLRVFLCHSSDDKPDVRGLYKLLSSESWIDPWFDENNIKPGQDWEFEIENAIEKTDVVIVWMSRDSVSKDGYIQKEIRIVLDRSDEKPDGTIFIIPIRTEECAVPKRLAKLQWLDISLSNTDWYSQLRESLILKARYLNIPLDELIAQKDQVYGELQSQIKQLELQYSKAERALEIREIELKAVLNQANYITNTDTLTQLPNRRKIINDLQEEVIRSYRYNTALSVIFFDLDNFKAINDRLGHLIGDRALADIGVELSGLVLQPNSIGRYGGEEFLIVLPESKLKTAIELAESLCQHIRTMSISYNEYSFQLTISVGVVQYRNGEENWEQLLVRADKALYIAKNNGGDQLATIEN